MGDFNLKTAPDYKIPEHMRINAAKKEEELGQLDSMVLRNTCVFQIKKNDCPLQLTFALPPPQTWLNTSLEEGLVLSGGRGGRGN